MKILEEVFFVIGSSGKAHVSGDRTDLFLRSQKIDFRPFDPREAEKLTKIHTGAFFDHVRQIKGAEMLSVRQFLQSDSAGMVLVQIIDDALMRSSITGLSVETETGMFF